MSLFKKKWRRGKKEQRSALTCFPSRATSQGYCRTCRAWTESGWKVRREVELLLLPPPAVGGAPQGGGGVWNVLRDSRRGLSCEADAASD